MEEKATELGVTTADRQAKLKADSGTWGNYTNSTFEIKKGKYSTDYGSTYTEVINTYTKPVNSGILISTGAITRNRVLNIYDLAGNEGEWTLEKNTSAVNIPSVVRGGDCYNNSISDPSNKRSSYLISQTIFYINSRPTLFK